MSPKQKPLVIVIAEERGLSTSLAEQLDGSGFASQIFHKGATALKFVQENHAHLVLLDPNLTDMDGLYLLDKIRRIPRAPAVIYLSAKGDAALIEQILDGGADDFVVQPHDPTVLMARIRAVLRRSETAGDQRLTGNADLATGVFRFNNAEVNPERLELSFGPSRVCKLGRKELGILVHLHANPGVIISKHSLIHAVWGVHADVRSRSVDQYVGKIRETFQRFGRPLNCFRTIHGIGYWYEPNQPEPPAETPVAAAAPPQKKRRA